MDEAIPEINVVGLQRFKALMDGVSYGFGLIGEDTCAVCEARERELGC